MRIRHLWILIWCSLLFLGGCSSEKGKPIIFVSNMDYPNPELGFLKVDGTLTSLALKEKAAEAQCSSTCRNIALVTEGPTSKSGISILDQDSGDTRIVVEPQDHLLENLQWSFDDKLIAYFEQIDSAPPGSGTVHILDSKTGESVAAFPDTLTFAWSPVSNTIALYKRQAMIEILDLEKKQSAQYSEPIVILPPFHDKFAWSADGRHLIVGDFDSLKIIDVSLMNTKQVILPIRTFNHYYTNAISASPVNEDQVLVAGEKQLRAEEQNEPVLWLVNIATGQVDELPARKGVRNAIWSPQGNQIAFNALSDPAKSDAENVYLVDLSNKTIRRILDKDLHIYSMSWR